MLTAVVTQAAVSELSTRGIYLFIKHLVINAQSAQSQVAFI